jgi:hypothetical protein
LPQCWQQQQPLICHRHVTATVVLLLALRQLLLSLARACHKQT